MIKFGIHIGPIARHMKEPVLSSDFEIQSVKIIRIGVLILLMMEAFRIRQGYRLHTNDLDFILAEFNRCDIRAVNEIPSAT